MISINNTTWAGGQNFSTFLVPANREDVLAFGDLK
jgi:hypothetical protein